MKIYGFWSYEGPDGNKHTASLCSFDPDKPLEDPKHVCLATVKADTEEQACALARMFAHDLNGADRRRRLAQTKFPALF